MEEKKTLKISLSTIFLVLAIIGIIVMAYYIYIEKANYNRKIAELEVNATKMQSTINDIQGKIDSISNTMSNIIENKFNTKNISYIVVNVEDTTADGLAYKSKKITDKQEIEELMNIINNATEYEMKSAIPDFGDIIPCVEIYNTNGERFAVAAGDQINDNGDIVNLMTKWYSIDGSNKTLFKVNIKLGEYIEKLYNN